MSRPLSPVVRPARRAARAPAGPALAALAALAVLALAGPLACRAGSDAAGADSVLSRDLTLAAAVSARPVFADSVRLDDTPVPEPAPVAPDPAPAPRPERRAEGGPERSPPPVRRPAASAEPTPSIPVAASTAPEPAAPPSAPAAAPAEAPAASRGRGIAAGTQLALRTTARICNETMRPGDRLVATLTEPVAAPDGAVLLPVGAEVVLELAALHGGPQPGGARLEFLARGVSLGDTFVPLVADVPPVDAAAEQQAIAKPAGQDRGKVIRGAITGAILGRVLGGGGARGTVIGAAAGAAAGAASAAASTRHQLCVAPDVPVRARLVQPLALP